MTEPPHERQYTSPRSEYAPGSHVSELIPRPDPTVLTTQLVNSAIANYREVVETRLDGMDKATSLLADELEKINTLAQDEHQHMRDDFDRLILSTREYILGQVNRVAEVGNEKFNAISMQFKERDTRTEQSAQDSRVSLDAALAAAKEAVGAQNISNTRAIEVAGVATQKQIDALAALMTTSNRSLEDKIADVKSRLDRGEGQGTGEDRSRVNVSQTMLITIAGVSVLVAVVSIVVSVVMSQSR